MGKVFEAFCRDLAPTGGNPLSNKKSPRGTGIEIRVFWEQLARSGFRTDEVGAINRCADLGKGTTELAMRPMISERHRGHFSQMHSVLVSGSYPHFMRKWYSEKSASCIAQRGPIHNSGSTAICRIAMRSGNTSQFQSSGIGRVWAMRYVGRSCSTFTMLPESQKASVNVRRPSRIS